MRTLTISMLVLAVLLGCGGNDHPKKVVPIEGEYKQTAGNPGGCIDPLASEGASYLRAESGSIWDVWVSRSGGGIFLLSQAGQYGETILSSGISDRQSDVGITLWRDSKYSNTWTGAVEAVQYEPGIDPISQSTLICKGSQSIKLVRVGDIPSGALPPPLMK